MKAKLDAIVNKLISRKLMVFLVACGGLFSGKLDGDNWVIVAAVYIGSEVAISYFERGKKAINKVEKIIENTETEKG